MNFGKRDYAIIISRSGIMHAVNSGALEAGTSSIGLKTELLTGEKITDPVFTDGLSFHFLLSGVVYVNKERGFDISSRWIRDN